MQSAIDQRVSLAVSTVIFALRPHPESGLMTLWLPLVRRIREPYEGQWALPGGPLEATKTSPAGARTPSQRTTGLTRNYLEQLYAFGSLDRSPDDRVVSIVYWALVQPDEVARAVDGENVEWFVADELPPLAFDHTEIVDYALARLRAKITYTPIAHGFLPREFTLAELRAVHEAVLRTHLDPANFRRQALASKTLVPTGTCLQGTSHRPPALFRFEAGPPSNAPEERR